MCSSVASVFSFVPANSYQKFLYVKMNKKAFRENFAASSEHIILLMISAQAPAVFRHWWTYGAVRWWEKFLWPPHPERLQTVIDCQWVFMESKNVMQEIFTKINSASNYICRKKNCVAQLLLKWVQLILKNKTAGLLLQLQITQCVFYVFIINSNFYLHILRS